MYLKNKVFFFFTYCCFSSLFAGNIDSIIKLKSKQYPSKQLFKKASTYFIAKNWDSTLVYAMKQLEDNPSPEIKNYCHYYRGSSFAKKKIFNEAKKEFSLISSNFDLENYLFYSLGLCELELNNYQKSLEYFKKLETNQKNNIAYINIEHIYMNIGGNYLYLKNYQEAKKYFFKCVKIYEASNNFSSLSLAYQSIANLYYTQYKDDLAIPYFKKSYEYAQKTKNYDLKRSAAKNMAVVEENRKNYKKALIYRNEYGKWKDSLNDQNKVWAVAKLEKEFAVKQKQKEVRLLQAENSIKEAQKRGFLYTALFLLVLLATAVYFIYEKVKTNRIITAQKENLNELNSTKDRLFSIVSHDLRSSVNALKSSNGKLLSNLENNNLEQLDTLLHNNNAIVNSAYSLLDNLLHWALLQTKQSYFDIGALRLFIITQQIAYNYQAIMVDKGIGFEFEVLKKDMVMADQESLKIILRNLIDNAIKFTSSGGSIKIYSQNGTNNYCDLVIEDTGMGMDETTRLGLLKDDGLLSKTENNDIAGNGLGLQLCKSMIAKNKGKFSIESKLGKGTKMIVSLVKA